jgi:hypothetical protein
MSAADLLVLGQSHAATLRHGAGLLPEFRANSLIFHGDTVRLIREGSESVIDGGWYGPALLEAVREEAARASNVAILWAGSQFLGRSLFIATRDFDVVFDGRPTLPGAQLIPRSGLEELGRGALSMKLLQDICSATRENCRGDTAFLAPPPPSPDHVVLAGFEKEPLLVRIAEESAGDSETPRVVAESVRIKLWRILVGLYSEYASEGDLVFVPPPAAAVGRDGLLTSEYTADASHANREYGALYIQTILRRLGVE